MALTNDQKAERYNQLLRQHDRLTERIADIKSEAAGMELNAEQKSKVTEYERQIQQVIAETRALFN
jgi:hypothetical protein